MTQIAGRHILITGGARGLGALIAGACADGGAAHITLWDIEASALREREAALRGRGASVSIRVVDVADPGAIAGGAEALATAPPVDILVNNAGIVTGRPLVEETHEDIERIFRVNTLGMIHTTRALLPMMIARGSGHIVNIASASGYLPVPRLTTYGASKWACLGFSESLRVELRAHPGLRVTTVCPSYIKTGMFAGVSAPFGAPLLEPDYAARRIMRAIARNSTIVRMPWIVHLVPALYALTPAPLFDRICGDWLGIYRSMDQFTGHGGAQGVDARNREGDGHGQPD